MQALVGFVLLTAAVSWVLQIFSALGRRRALAVHLTTLERAGAAEQLGDLDAGVAAHLLLDVAHRLADEGQRAQSREARLAASALRHTIGVFAGTLSREGLLESAATDTRAVLTDYRHDHA